MNIICNTKQQVATCCLVLLMLNSYSQTPFVNQWFTSGVNSFWHFEELPDSSFVLGGIQEIGSIYPTSSFFMRCNKDGDSLYTFKCDSGTVGGMELLNDSQVAVIGLHTDPFTLNIATVNFITGDTSNQTQYPGTGGGHHLHLCPDKGLVMLHYNAGNYEIIKVDSNYNMQWHTASCMAYGAEQIKPDPLGGYVVVGNHGLVTNPYAVQRLDSAGNNIWCYGYGSVPLISLDDDFIASDVVIADDSNYIVSCAREIETFMKINRITGDTIWTRSGNDARLINNAGNDTYITVTDTFFSLINGNGDFIWQAPIVPTGFIIHHCDKTLDGGYAFCGTSSNYQTMVFVKLDSLGNTVNTSIFDIEKHKQVYFYPNPASDVLNFAHTTSSNFTFSVCNLFGNKVSFVTNKTSIDVSALTPGIYVAEVREGKKVTREKFIKQ